MLQVFCTKKLARSDRDFSFRELLVVNAIIAILAAGLNSNSERERERARPGRSCPRPHGKPARTKSFQALVAASMQKWLAAWARTATPGAGVVPNFGIRAYRIWNKAAGPQRRRQLLIHDCQILAGTTFPLLTSRQ
jgi:predicted nucleic acid-binding protein